MARTPLLSRLQRLAARMAEAEGPRPTRREVLEAAGAAGLVLAGAPLARAARPKRTLPSVAVVGGGLSGLVAAWRLREAGVLATVYEASSRVGGRVFTNRGTFADGQRVERGGELIDTGHKAYRKLVQQLGFQLDDLLKAEPNGTEAFYRFDGAPYTEAQAEADFQPVYHVLKKDVIAAGYPTLYTSFTPAGFALDHLSIADWIESRVPGGMASPFGQLLAVAYDIEYGAEPEEQSALNLVYLLGFGATPGRLELFGGSDERYRVQGGNDQVPAALGALLSTQVRLQHVLVAAATEPGGTLRLTFDTPGGAQDVVADRVVMTLPFSVLRASVDTSALSLSPLKRIALAELGMGTNSKLHVQFSARPWYALGNNGETYADLGYQNTWEETRAQSGASGILVDYTGGTIGAGFGSGTPQARAQQFLAEIEPVLPGLTARWNGLASVDFWTGSPYQLGSYSYWKVGQYTRFAGIEREAEGNLHFAGEHTSVDFQGFMEGAVESGERAAGEVLDAL